MCQPSMPRRFTRLSCTVPSDVTASGRLPERPKGAVCKTVGLAYAGSNPAPATTRNTRSEPLRRPPGRRGARSQAPPDAAVCRSSRDMRGMTGRPWTFWRPTSTNRGARGFLRGDISITHLAARRLSACSRRPGRRLGTWRRRGSSTSTLRPWRSATSGAGHTRV